MFQKCFISVFNNYLKSFGFQRKGNLFYRMNGDILQGVTIHKGWDESVTLSFFPFWMIRSQLKGTDVGKGYWADKWRINSPFSISKPSDPAVPDTVVYDTGDNDLDRMLAAKDKFDRVCMPLLDRVYDLDSFLYETAYFDSAKYAGFEGTRLTFAFADYQRPLLLKAYRDGSFDDAARIADHLLDTYRVKQATIFKRLIRDNPGCYPSETTAEELADREVMEAREKGFSLLDEKIQEGDMEWIRVEYLSMVAEAETLLANLKLSVKMSSLN